MSMDGGASSRLSEVAANHSGAPVSLEHYGRVLVGDQRHSHAPSDLPHPPAVGQGRHEGGEASPAAPERQLHLPTAADLAAIARGDVQPTRPLATMPLDALQLTVGDMLRERMGRPPDVESRASSAPQPVDGDKGDRRVLARVAPEKQGQRAKEDASKAVPERDDPARVEARDRPKEGDAPTGARTITIAFSNLAEGVEKRPGEQPVATAIAEMKPEIIGFCEAPISRGAIGEIKNEDRAMAGLVGQLEELLSSPLTQRIVTVHPSFEPQAPSDLECSGLAVASRYSVITSEYHKLVSPPLTEGDTFHKGVLRLTVKVDGDGRELKVCVLHLAAAYRFEKNLSDPMFNQMHGQLREATKDADVVIGDFNGEKENEHPSQLNDGQGFVMKDFVLVELGEPTYMGWDRQSDYAAYNPNTFSGVERTWNVPTRSDHNTVGLKLILKDLSVQS